MSDNSSSYNSSLNLLINICFQSEMSVFVFSAMSVTNLVLLPVFLLVLYLGYQQRCQQRSMSPSSTSHSNLFTYHAAAMHLNEILGFLFLFCGSYNNLLSMICVGLGLLYVTTTGQAMFHILTCVEHYLAVVHPVTYLHLKQAGEGRITNICVGCVWLLSFGWLVLYIVGNQDLIFILYLCILAFSLTIISFCSISVLCALKRRGPGEVGGNKERFDQSKQRAFYTILTIMGVFIFTFVWNLIDSLIDNSQILSPSNRCVVFIASYWSDLPSSLVLPLLFLHRAVKLQCCKQNNQDKS